MWQRINRGRGRGTGLAKQGRYGPWCRPEGCRGCWRWWGGPTPPPTRPAHTQSHSYTVTQHTVTQHTVTQHTALPCGRGRGWSAWSPLSRLPSPAKTLSVHCKIHKWETFYFFDLLWLTYPLALWCNYLGEQDGSQTGQQGEPDRPESKIVVPTPHHGPHHHQPHQAVQTDEEHESQVRKPGQARLKRGQGE